MSFDDIAKYIADKLLSLLEPRLEAFANRFLRHNVRLTFSTPEAAAMLGVSPSTLEKFRNEGRINFCKYERSPHYLLADLLDFAERHKTRGNDMPIIPTQFALNATPFGISVERTN
jgi:Helix-turn-helix domain